MLFQPLAAFEKTEFKGTPGGVYVIRTCEGRIYVGCSNSVCGRIFGHLCALRKGRHPIKELQADFKRLGEDAFEAWWVEQISMAPGSARAPKAAERERWWIRSFFENGIEVYNSISRPGLRPFTP
jgi:hypothetical protein